MTGGGQPGAVPSPGGAAPDQPQLSGEAAHALAAKYATLLELRAPGAPRATPEQLRQLSAAFPGALRELAWLTTAELERRRAALCAAAEGGPPEAWMAWLHDFHAELRAAAGAPGALGARPSRGAVARVAARHGVPVATVAAVVLLDQRPGRAAARARPAGPGQGGAP